MIEIEWTDNDGETELDEVDMKAQFEKVLKDYNYKYVAVRCGYVYDLNPEKLGAILVGRTEFDEARFSEKKKKPSLIKMEKKYTDKLRQSVLYEKSEDFITKLDGLRSLNHCAMFMYSTITKITLEGGILFVMFDTENG
jgi:hypothetical protein